MQRERIVVFEDGADLTADVVVREPAPLVALMPVFVPVGAGREEYDRAAAVEAEYLPPRARAA